MVFRIGEPISIWRTHGGLYAWSNGRAKKATTLRISPHGVGVGHSELVSIYEIVRTWHGLRHRRVSADDVSPGTQLYLNAFSGPNITISEIQDVYSGTRVAAVAPGRPHLVYTDQLAWLLPEGNPAESRPLLAEGWDGAQVSFTPSGVEQVVLLDHVDEGVRARTSWVNDHAPGWQPVLEKLADQLHAANSMTGLSDARASIDGSMVVRLNNVPVDRTGRAPEDFERIVRQLTGDTSSRCMVCGEFAVPWLEPGVVPSTQQSYCVDHMSPTSTRLLPAQSAGDLPPRLRNERTRVDPGWYALITELDSELSKYGDYWFQSCTQVLGRLNFRVSCPVSLSDAERYETVRRIGDAIDRSETICEHCGRSGALRESPWLHVCCGHCESAVST